MLHVTALHVSPHQLPMATPLMGRKTKHSLGTCMHMAQYAIHNYFIPRPLHGSPLSDYSCRWLQRNGLLECTCSALQHGESVSSFLK